MQGLLDRFITTTFGASEWLDSACTSLKENNTLLSAVHAAVLLELIPHQAAFEVQEHGNVSIDRIPILVVAASFSLADSEKKGNKVYSVSLTQLLRSRLFLITAFCCSTCDPASKVTHDIVLNFCAGVDFWIALLQITRVLSYISVGDAKSSNAPL